MADRRSKRLQGPNVGRRGGRAALIPEEHRIHVEGQPTRYLAAGKGPPLVLLHGVGDNALDWAWVMPALARENRVYAPDLPGSGGSAGPRQNDYSPASFKRFLAAFLDALGLRSAAVVGNSLGGLVGLRLASDEPERVVALGLLAGAGLGRRVSPALRSLALPGYGGLAVAWGQRPPGAAQRALGRAALLFARPRSIPADWLKEQYRLARMPGFLEAQLDTLRAQVGLRGQRELVLDRLPSLGVPTLVVWGERDRIFPHAQAREAIARIPDGSLELIPDCGHLPQVERPDRVGEILARFLAERTPG